MSAPFEPLTVGSVCTGYGGLDGVLSLVLGAHTIWTADNDDDVATLLAARFPGVPNLGDIKAVDWQTVTRPDILCAGFPCQDISPAGIRAGIQPGNRSGLWTWIAYMIDVLRPAYVFIENSRGLTSAKAYSDVEQCAFCVGDGSRNPALRALGRVVGDLADIGYDTEWRCVRASTVGAPHDRHRAFIWAWDRTAADAGRGDGQARVAAAGSSPVLGRRPAGASRDAQRRGRQPAADAGRGSIRRTTGDTASAAGEGTRSVQAGERPGGQRLRLDDRHARARSDADADSEPGPERDSEPPPGFGASRRPDTRRRGRATAADAAGVRSGQGRLTRSGQTAGDGASGVSVGCDRTSADADPAEHGRWAERAGVGGRSDAVGDSSATADADRSELARQPDEQPGRTAAARPGRPVADASSARLEVGSVELARHERATAERDDRDRHELGTDADAGSVRRSSGSDITVRRPEERTVARRADTNAGSTVAVSWRRAALADAVRRDGARRIHDGDAGPDFPWIVGERDYTQAIRTWEAITGRTAPLPAVANRRGDHRLNPRFSEWMMGLPDGWVTGVPGLSRTAQLRIIGNGLVPAQGALALMLLLGAAQEEES